MNKLKTLSALACFCLCFTNFAANAGKTFMCSVPEETLSGKIDSVDNDIVSSSFEGQLRFQGVLEKGKYNTDTEIEEPMVAPGEQILTSNDEPQLLLRPQQPNALVATLIMAYNNHIPVAIRPDDVWLTIMSNFSHYVSTHSEQMQSKFVGFQGQKELIVTQSTGANVDLANLPRKQWEDMIDQFSKLIDEEVGKDIVDWAVPNFTTTTNDDRVAGRMALMDAVSGYFAYTSILACGLPKVTLEGSLDDWKKVRSRAERLKSFGGDLEKWAVLLAPVLDEFIASYQGKVNHDFWERMATSERLGSGSQQGKSGWILVFSPFNLRGEYRLNTAEKVAKSHSYGNVMNGEFITTMNKVDIKVIQRRASGDVVSNIKLLGGPAMVEYRSDQNQLRTFIGWAIAK